MEPLRLCVNTIKTQRLPEAHLFPLIYQNSPAEHKVRHKPRGLYFPSYDHNLDILWFIERFYHCFRRQFHPGCIRLKSLSGKACTHAYLDTVSKMAGDGSFHIAPLHLKRGSLLPFSGFPFPVPR
jgi:hypothetical protein